MNVNQKVTIAVGLATCAIAGLFPPWALKAEEGTELFFQYLLKPPYSTLDNARISLDLRILFVEWCVIGAVTAIVFLFLRSSLTAETSKDEKAQEQLRTDCQASSPPPPPKNSEDEEDRPTGECSLFTGFVLVLTAFGVLALVLWAWFMDTNDSQRDASDRPDSQATIVIRDDEIYSPKTPGLSAGVAGTSTGASERSSAELDESLFTSHAGMFRIAFPGEPQVRQMRHPSLGHDFHVHTCETDNAVYGVVYHDYPPETVKGGREAILLAEKKAYLRSIRGQAIRESSVTVGGWDGVEIEYETAQVGRTVRGRRRFIMVGNRMYTFYCAGLKETITPDRIADFLDSFELLAGTDSP